MVTLLIRVVRTIKSDPWYAGAVILTLGLGIGVSTSAFTVLDRLVLRDPAQLHAPDALRRVFFTYLPSQFTRNETIQRYSVSYPEYRAVLEAVGGTGQVTGYENWPTRRTVRLAGEARAARVLGVATSYFSTLGVGPRSGRFFAAPSSYAAANGAPLEAVVSERYWSRALGGRPDILGTTLEVYHQKLAVVGVALDGFSGANLDGPDFWIPWEISVADGHYGPQWTTDWNATVFSVVIRRSSETADPDLGQRIGIEMSRASEAAGREQRFGPAQFPTLTEALAPDFEREIRFATALWVVSLVVLLVAAVNAGGLFLVRSEERWRTTAVALAIGARRGRLVREQMFEGITLALLGALLGAALSTVGSELVRISISDYIRYDEGPIAWRALGYATGLAIAVGAIGSVIPAWRSIKVDLRALLDDAGQPGYRQGFRLARLVSGLQVAFAVLVLYGAALFVRSGMVARAVPLGLDIDRVVVATAELKAEGYDSTAIRTFWDQVASEIQQDPAVERAGLGSALLFRSWGGRCYLVGEKRSCANVTVADANYLDALRIKLIGGRSFEPADGPGSEHVGLINRTGAQRFWPGQSPIGQCLDVPPPARGCIRIVGTVEDTRRHELIEDKEPQVYLAWAQEPVQSDPFLAVRARPGAVPHTLDRLRAAMVRRVPAATQFSVARMTDDLDRATAQWVRSGQVLLAFGILAAIVTFVGIYGTVAYSQLRRRRELGIRLALGARPAMLTRSVVAQMVGWCGMGAVVGVGLAVVAALGIRAMLFGTEPWNPAVLILAPLVIVLVVATAAWIGARRSAVRDPSFLLRTGR